jgi:hypothetical protein
LDTAAGFAIPGIAFLLTLVSGAWLGVSGRPYNGLLFNVHKLIALGAVIVTAIQIYQALEGPATQALLIALIVVAGLCVLALFVTGAMMSMGKPGYDVLRIVHSAAPFLAAIAMAVAVYLLGGGRIGNTPG